MKGISGLNFIIGFLLVLATFDSVVVPFFRLSIADIVMLVSLPLLGIRFSNLEISFTKLAKTIAMIFIINTIAFLSYEAWRAESDAEYSLLISGFLRPILFTNLAFLFYAALHSNKISKEDLYKSIHVGGCILAFLVILQYFGLFFPTYHNNPSFGEIGRWNYTSLGWRPTGLSNEASFVGVYLVLFFSGSLWYLKSKCGRNKLYYSISSFFIFIGCVLSTSRIALLLACLVYFVFFPNMLRSLFGIFILIVWGSFQDLSRYRNLLAFGGDASTIERYGSIFSYLASLKDPRDFFGTGYLNSRGLISKHIDSAVIMVLKDRSLPAFSLPLQLAVDFGPLLFLVFCFYVIVMYKKELSNIKLVPILLVSIVTGIQNFLFCYIFFALVIYERNSRSI